MFALKSYQQRALDHLQGFLVLCQSGELVEAAYQQTLAAQGMPALDYKPHGFGQVPNVCFRIPTGGGKTVLGSYAIETVAKQYLGKDYPMVLWLVPTNTIRLQTVAALKTPDHPYRERLDKAFKHQVLVLDIDEVTQLRPQDIGNKTVVVVSTLANLRVKDKSGRRVYAYHENFEPHFAKVTEQQIAQVNVDRVTEGDMQANGLGASELGKVKYSFANLIALNQPMVIVDEAHNARTPLSFDTLQRMNPSVIIELTATPNDSAQNGSNVLFHVSASELKAEQMIKLPIVLTEHQNWQNAIRDAVISRNKLAKDAVNDADYIRPIALFQAEPKNGEITVEVLKAHLIEQLNIPANNIAIATGNQRELDGLNLFDPSCPIEYIITIEALKEGWDCSFAYVFCSVKQVSSSKDAEQLLGRVLRMPYARRRVIEDLNRAYAHLATSSFSNAAQQLTDKLIAMGFEAMEVANFLRQQAATDNSTGELFDENAAPLPTVRKPAIVLERDDLPDLTALTTGEVEQVTMTQNDDKVLLKVDGEITEDLAKRLTQGMKKAAREAAEQTIRIHNASIQAAKAPSEYGQSFGQLPQLCVCRQGELELVEAEIFLDSHSWNVLDFPAELPNFKIAETTNSFTIDIDGQQLSYKIASEHETLAFNTGFIGVTEHDLIVWLSHHLRPRDIFQGTLIDFLAKLINNLLQQPNLKLTTLVRNKYPLARAIKDLLQRYRRQAQEIGYTANLFGDAATACLDDEFVYAFKSDVYPSKPPYYSGRYQFQKHYFPISVIEDLKATGEECQCAMVIDSLPQVKYWIRNLVNRSEAAFWLPLAHGKFYPDFVCQLTDGRMLVVEYKGEVYASNDDSAVKCNIGQRWASLSNGQCLFIMAVLQDSQGRNVQQQILDVIEST